MRFSANLRLFAASVLLFLGLGKAVAAEKWVEISPGLKGYIDTDSCKVNEAGNVVYRVGAYGRDRWMAIIVLERTSTGMVRTLSKEEDGRPSFSFSREWKNGRDTPYFEQEMAILAPYFRPTADSQPQSQRWVKFSRGADGSDWYYDTQSVTWFDQRNSCRVWQVKVSTGESPDSEEAKSYVYYSDRTFMLDSGKSSQRLPIRPNSIAEVIWNKLFGR